MSTARKLAFVLCGVASAAGCSCDDRQVGLTSDLACVDCPVDGEGRLALEYGVVEVGATSELALTVRNGGADSMNVVVPAIGPAFRAVPGSFTLPAGATQTVTFTYAPGAEMEDTASARIAGGVGQRLDVQLHGRGTVIRVECAPDALSFGAVVVERTRELPVRCRNLDPYLPAYVNVLLDGDREFTLGETSSQVIPPEGSVVLPLTFAPLEPGGRAARVLVDDRQSSRVAALSLTGRGIDSGLHIAPGPGQDGCYDVGFVAPGRSATLPLAAINEGNVPVHVTGTQVEPADAPFRLEPGAPFTVEPAELDGPPGNVPLTVAFTPPSLGSFTATIHVDSDDHDNGRIDLCVKGVGGGPLLQCTPAVLPFGLTDIATPRTRPVFCTNVGTQVPGVASDLHVGQVMIGDPFLATATDAQARAFAPGETFRVDVTFAPMTEDVFTSQLEVASDGGPAVVRVTGQGKVFEPCTFSLRPLDGLDYGVLNRDKSFQLEEIFVNEGSSDCLIADVDLEGSLPRFFQVGEGWDQPRVVPPGETARLPVTFLGAAPGAYDASLDLTVNGPGRISRPLHANAMDLCFSISVENADYGTVAPGCSSPKRWIQILNACREPMIVTQVDIPAVETNDFKLLQTPELPFYVAGGAVAEVQVAYQPFAEGPDVGFLRVYTDRLPGPVIGELLGNGGYIDVQTDHFAGIGKSSADILWVIDNSGSMGEEQDGIAKNAPPFIDVAIDRKIDFRMGVTSTDAETGLNGRLYPLDLGHPRILASFMDREDLEKDWAYLVNQGTNGSGDEKGLKAARMALSPPLITSLDLPETSEKYDGNLGFLRRDANLAIVIVSDERDHSYDVTPTPTYWEDFVNFFRNIKGERRSATMLRVHTITGGEAGCATAEPGYGYNEVASATGGVIQSICASDWSEALQTIAEQAFTFERCFTLHGLPGPGPGVTDPDPETWLTVRLDDKPYDKISGGNNVRWSYYPETNEICFADYYAPRPEDFVDVKYNVACGSVD